MKKCAVLLVALMILAGCAPKSYQAVGSLENLANKEEIEKKQNWVKLSGGTAVGAGAGTFVSVFLFGLAGLPAAAIIASLPDQEGLSMVELGDIAAATANELDEHSSVVYADGPGSNYGIISLPGSNADPVTGARAVALLYFWDKDEMKRLYGEVLLVKKTDAFKYSAWKTPLLKKNDKGELVYSFNERMRLKDTVTVARDRTILLAFLDDANGGREVTRDATTILTDAAEHYRSTKLPLLPLRCAAGDKVCGEGTNNMKE